MISTVFDVAVGKHNLRWDDARFALLMADVAVCVAIIVAMKIARLA